MLPNMAEKSKEKKGIEDVPEEELLKTKHGMAAYGMGANRPRPDEPSSESVPDEI
jgi:hypothetical protein